MHGGSEICCASPSFFGAGRGLNGGGWTLTPTSASWTHTPTQDSSCFADADNFDCQCHSTKQRHCKYAPSSHCVSTDLHGCTCAIMRGIIVQGQRLPQATEAQQRLQLREFLRVHPLQHLPIVCHTDRHTDTQTGSSGRRADRQAGRNKERKTGRRAGGRAGGQAGRDRPTDRLTKRSTNQTTDGSTKRRTER